jgi:hypothetical protein
MGLEIRNARQHYYYRRQRDGKSVKRVHIGAGSVAHEAAAQDALRKAKREADRQEAQRTVAMLEPLDALGTEFDEGLWLLTMATLFAGGHAPAQGPVAEATECGFSTLKMGPRWKSGLR